MFKGHRPPKHKAPGIMGNGVGKKAWGFKQHYPPLLHWGLLSLGNNYYYHHWGNGWWEHWSQAGQI